jgi:hypothetical protein
MDVLLNLPAAVTIVLGLLLVAWLVLLLLVPFMIESIRGSTRKAHLELEAINQKLDLLTTLLAERPSSTTPERQGSNGRVEPRADAASRRREVADIDGRQARREPTI